MKYKNILLICIIITLLTLSGCQPRDVLSNYDVNGTVTVRGSNEGVENVKIQGGNREAITSENGKFSMKNVSGNITVEPQKNGWEFEPESKEITVGTFESSSKVINFEGIKMDYDISGKITDENDEDSGIPDRSCF